MATRKAVINYIRKNYSPKTFAEKHHFKIDGVRRFLDGDNISEEAFKMLVSCIEVVDGHLFNDENDPKPFTGVKPGAVKHYNSPKSARSASV